MRRIGTVHLPAACWRRLRVLGAGGSVCRRGRVCPEHEDSARRRCRVALIVGLILALLTSLSIATDAEATEPGVTLLHTPPIATELIPTELIPTERIATERIRIEPTATELTAIVSSSESSPAHGTRAAPSDTLVILYVGETQGNLAPCSCPEQPWGGLARRVGFFREAHRNHGTALTLLFDTGGFLP